MTSADVPGTRRALRQARLAQQQEDDQALGWVDGDDLPTPEPPQDLELGPAPQPQMVWLLPPKRRRSRAPYLVPLGIVVAMIVAYVVAVSVWPLDAVTPTVTAATLHPAAADDATITWPEHGAAAVGVTGIGGPVASTTSQSAIASITKIVTALLVLEEAPLKPGEAGPDFSFTAADESSYWQYRRRNESALDVPVGGTLSEYQMLEGMLLASANNYATRLADELWPTRRAYADAAMRWLDAHGVNGITIVGPSGFDHGNTATPSALIKVARLAMADPVISQIVAKRTAKLPGIGTVHNTNQLLKDPGVVGMKTGTLEGYNLLVVKNVDVGDTSVQIEAVTLNQPTSDIRWKTARDLLSQVEAQLAPAPAVTAGTTVASVSTEWGATATLTAAKNANVIVWNKARPVVKTAFRLGDDWTKGAKAGALTATGPVDATAVPVVFAGDLTGPGFWWRLTHPLDLIGAD